MPGKIDESNMKGSHELSYDVTFKKESADGLTITYYNSKGQVIPEPPVPWT